MGFISTIVQFVPDFEGKPLYGLRRFQVGAFVDAHERKDKYWYWAGLKKYVTYFWSYTASASQIMWTLTSRISAGNFKSIEATPKPKTRSWWSYVIPDRTDAKNETIETELEFSEPIDYNGSEICIEASNGKLRLALGPDELSLSDFVTEGIRRERNFVDYEIAEEWLKSEADAFLWHPHATLNNSEESEKLFYLDNEGVDIRGPLLISVIPRKLIMFCEESVRQNMLGYGGENEEAKKKWWQRGSNVSKMAKNK